MEQYYLYCLVRTDMESLGRGKSIAQGMHAANAFTWDTIIEPMLAGKTPSLGALTWSQEAAGFGTTITLAATIKEMEKTIDLAVKLGFPARLVADPEYPLLDGKTFHLIPDVVTTAYIFGRKSELASILGDFDLVPNDPVG